MNRLDEKETVLPIWYMNLHSFYNVVHGFHSNAADRRGEKKGCICDRILTGAIDQFWHFVWRGHPLHPAGPASEF